MGLHAMKVRLMNMFCSQAGNNMQKRLEMVAQLHELERVEGSVKKSLRLGSHT